MSESSGVDRVSMIVLRSMRGPLFVLIGVYAVGIAGFGLIPGSNGDPMSFFHALYFLSYTATTTGFGELPLPFSNAQRLWAVVLLHVSVVAWLYSIGAIIELLQNPHFRRARSRRVFAHRIDGMDEPFVIICGFGDAGSLLARGLNEQRISSVVIDKDPDRIKALALRNFSVRVPGVCADSSDPRVLLDAGLQNPNCNGIVALTDDEYANIKTTVMTRVLNANVTPICRVESPAAAQELDALGNVTVLDSFEVFADRLCVALHRPALYVLSDWLVRMQGVTLEHRLECPLGKWIVCGYGRMGHRLEENLHEEGIEVTVIDPGIPEEEEDKGHIRGSADLETLKRAGIEDAACVIVATDSDTVNLRIMMMVRKLNPKTFLVLRQNHYTNEVAFANLPIDIVMHPDRVISRRIQLELLSPSLQPLLDHLQARPVTELERLIERLQAAVGDELPVVWTLKLDEESAPALAARGSPEETAGMSLRDLTRSPTDRDVSLCCVPLILEHDGEEQRLPEGDVELTMGDRLLFCGTRAARHALGAALRNPYTLEYLISGEEPPRSYASRYLQRRRERSATSVDTDREASSR